MASDILASLLAQIRGSQMKVPPLKPYYDHWRQSVSPLGEQLVPLVEELLKEYVPEKKHLAHARASAFSLFAAAWFPDADLERLQFCTIYAIFLFFWDDAVDRESGSYQPDVANSIELGSKHRSEATAYLKYHLGFLAEGTPEPPYTNPHLELFAKSAKILRRKAAQDTVVRFLDEVNYYIDYCQWEQEDRLAGKFPSLDTYWAMRLGTSSVYTFCAFAPYMIDVSLPQDLLNSPEVRACWVEINKNVVFENDILSLKKEITDGAIISLVPITMNESKQSLNEAVETTVKEFGACCNRFDEAAAKLRRKATEFDSTVQKETDRLIKCYETMQWGCYHWSMQTGRYGVTSDVQQDGSLIVTF
ncbi:isoprenoid synthase domain-containing protein [Xylariales sp. AK1849]|nr:isoprenoid synthase domain-containing protein [Xylariales sp. AK1849]